MTVLVHGLAMELKGTGKGSTFAQDLLVRFIICLDILEKDCWFVGFVLIYIPTYCGKRY